MLASLCFWMWVCHSIAKRKGYSTGWAEFWGFGFTWLAAIIYATLPSKERQSIIDVGDYAFCPICESDTILRTVKKGKDTGKQFYVCMKYPKCKGKVQIGSKL